MPDADEFLKIETVLKDQDRIEPPAAFLLATVKGTEGMSFPYTYDVTLLRKTSRRDLEPRELIGTPCSISIRRKRTSKEEQEAPPVPEFDVTVRHGVFEHLSRVAGAWKSEFRVYVGRVVPAFTLLARESRHRIFEDADVTSILKRSLEGAPHLFLDTEMLELEKFPVLDYCVQFGETTFAFVSRLMARYGIWYYFDHEGLDPTTGKPRGRETLVLGRSFTGNITPARHPKVIVIGDKKRDDAGVVFNFVRRYDPSGRRVDVGNFNPLNPTAPFTGAAAASEQYAAQVVNAPAAQRFEDVAFPEPVLSDQEAEDDARQLMRREESAVYSVTGLSREVSFRAGRIFIVTQDQTAPGDVLDVPTRRIFGGQDPKYVVTFLSFVASEVHGRTVANTFLELFTMLYQNLVSNLGLGDDQDLTLGIVNDMLNNYLVDMQEVAWRNAFDIGPSSERGAVLFTPAALAGGGGALAEILFKTLVKVVGGLLRSTSSYGNSFVAVPSWPDGDFDRPVPVAAPRVVAHGPHLAVVVGPRSEGSDGEREIWADALGRVRVRFPWDPGPPGSAASRFRHDENTCWVRVAQGWAGAGFGSQFLPRIGQQVLVEFVDGDPERPVIVGGVYSAPRGFTNLPFPSPGTRDKALQIAEWRKPTLASAQFERSGIKTRSTPPGRNAKVGFHLIRLDDTTGEEQFLLRAQRRLDVTALGSCYETIHGARHTTIGGRDPKTGEGAGDSVTRVSGEYHLRVDQSRREEVGRDYQFEVRGDADVQVDGNVSARVGGTASLSAGTIVLSADQQITLRVGGSSVQLTPGGVYITGPVIHLNSGGPPRANPASWC